MKILRSLITVLPFLLASQASAESSRIQWDVEVDPIAYAMQGFSVHLGLSPAYGRWDLGVYGMKLPSDVVDNDNFEASFRGAGVKWDLKRADERGWFLGIEGGWSEQKFVHIPSSEELKLNEYSYGVRGGYRFIISSVTITPWLGLGYSPNTDNIVIAGDELKRSRYTVFPTVHIGYLF
ncbi:MAG TPA: hypothetical protein VFO10_17895 [Oligoflexus sp.]|uniref:hypothetical protein n=1 Tax=Oligoflexus sp. TaxID=1971216 RepID=UPI002D803BB0|nr:hypothetical protein [Oligoflexus sp.]HET9239137.1 hypothetical protein [Oligoflexus sp.]